MCWLACAGNLEVVVDAAGLAVRFHARVAGKQVGSIYEWASHEDTGNPYMALRIERTFIEIRLYVERVLRAATGGT